MRDVLHWVDVCIGFGLCWWRVENPTALWFRRCIVLPVEVPKHVLDSAGVDVWYDKA